MYRRCISYFSSSFGLGVNDVKHGFTEAELAAVMAAFDTHPEAGK
ncbi:arylamine N-acetyltransferase [Salmonella enterica subsp. enterica]|uniref:Arylamine N-acetyltransferase n=1 Tax=Salmonella enterica I TaxID=59201 RepID=A0A379USI3_SALET|nr:arylamine N-acetyltransferase [Salmonella enterica subsp. enterica]